MRTITRAALTAIAAAAALAVGGAPASADSLGGGQTPDGYYAKVQVTLTGDVDQGAVGSIPGPPPLCWWTPVDLGGWENVDVDPDDPAAVEKYYQEYMLPYLTGHAGAGSLAYPDADAFKAIIKRAKAGEDVTFYELNYGDGVDAGTQAGAQKIADACGTTIANFMDYPVLMSWQAFTPGEVPPPAVDPRDLADYAYDVMDLVQPTLQWNPTMAARDDATLVNLPTWLWTEDPVAVEERQVVASAAGTTVTVTAQPQGMSVSSPVAGVECTAEQAGTAYAPGVDEASACVLTFPAASVAYPGGFPVQSATSWQAAWTSNVGEGGQLQGRVEDATTTIPVIEVQARVNQVG